MRTLLLGLALLLSVGCVPVQVSEVPDLKGTIRRGAEPVTGAEVRWLTNIHSGSDSRRLTEAGKAVTNERGEFSLSEVKGTGIAILLPAHSFSEWRLEVKIGGSAVSLWHERQYAAGPRGAPEYAIVLDCDIALPNPCGRRNNAN
jgi:hypothetical protein